MELAKRDQKSQNRQVNLFLEEICSELCRFQHVVADGLDPSTVKVHREVDLGGQGRYADIRVYFAGDILNSYFVEVHYGATAESVIRSVVRKFGAEHELTLNSKRLILLPLNTEMADQAAFEADLKSKLHPDLILEIWDEKHFLEEVNKHFDVEMSGITDEDLLKIRQAIEDAKWKHAFGDKYADHHLASSLSWHFGDWTMRRLHQEQGLEPEEIASPGHYQEVAIVMADLSGFSSFVRHTHDQSICRDCLSIFYSAARDAIHNAGGMLYQFVGDEAVGIFGVPDRSRNYTQDALNCAEALVEIGDSVAIRWQRELDFLQESKGSHVGIGMGALNLLPFRPFSADYVGFIGDALNLTARLTSVAGPGEVVVSNVFFQHLDQATSARFERMAPVDAKNVGRVLGWRLPARANGDD
jgi:class 3 adenylate cyclase